MRLEGKQNGTVLKSFTSNAGTDLCLVAQESVIKKLTRHKGQTVLDLQPSEIVEYSPEFGFGVKVVGIKVTVHCCNYSLLVTVKIEILLLFALKLGNPLIFGTIHYW